MINAKKQLNFIKISHNLEQYKGGDDFDKSGTDYKMKAVNNMLNKEVLP